MKKWSRRKRWLVGTTTGLGFLLLLFFGSFFAIGYFNLFHAHEHCIKNSGMSLRIYASEHFGQFPLHTNGFGDAIVTFLKENSPDDARYFAAPGDDGHLLKKCLETGTHMREAQCTRTYVEGLSETNNPEIAMVFDRYPTRGGDHFRRPWGPLLREVCLADGSMQVIHENNWPEFQRKQIALLVADGFARPEVEKLYKPMPNLK